LNIRTLNRQNLILAIFSKVFFVAQKQLAKPRQRIFALLLQFSLTAPYSSSTACEVVLRSVQTA